MSDDVQKTVHGRLLDAAENLFAEHGFEGTSVRDLAAAADCNLAAVNYYFGSKERLYTEFWRSQLQVLRKARIAGIQKVMAEGNGKPGLEGLLLCYINAFMEPLADKARSQRLIRLMAREILDPRLPSDILFTEMVGPIMSAMTEAFRKVCPNLDESKIPLIMVLLAGMLIHVARVRVMFDDVDAAKWPAYDVNEAVQSIVKFSAAGIRALVEQEGVRERE